MDKFNISTLNYEVLCRSKFYIRTYLDIIHVINLHYKKHGILIIICIVLVPFMIIIIVMFIDSSDKYDKQYNNTI